MPALDASISALDTSKYTIICLAYPFCECIAPRTPIVWLIFLSQMKMWNKTAYLSLDILRDTVVGLAGTSGSGKSASLKGIHDDVWHRDTRS